jgi:hypothetical protein
MLNLRQLVHCGFAFIPKLRVLAALYVKGGSGNAPNFGIRRFVELGHHP